jgi:hypothetical protein
MRMLIPLSPKPGLNSDDTSFSVQGRWAEGNNVRFVHGRPQTIGGQDDQFTVDAANGTCVCIYPFNRAGTLTIGYGFGLGGSKLFVGTELNAPSDRTPIGVPTNPDAWSLAAWGSTLLASPKGGTLYEQSGASTATEVTQAPDRIDGGILVTPERQVLAFGCNEEGSGTFNALCIRGSDIEDYTDWTSSPTNNAFEHVLEGSGAIVGRAQVGPYVAVWTTNALYLGQFVGNPDQTYRFDKVADCGLVGPNAQVVKDGVAYFVSSDLRIRVWAPGSPPQTLPCPISDEFSSLAYPQYIVASVNSRFNEVRFDFRSGSIVFPPGNTINRYIAVCLEDGSWYAGAGGRTAIVDDGAIGAYAAGQTIADGPSVFACMYDFTNNIFYLHDTGVLSWTNGSGASMLPYIQSGDLYLDESKRRVMVRSIIPDLEDQSEDVSVTLYVRDRPQSDVTVKGPYTLTTTATKKDMRASGKVIAVRIGGREALNSSYFRLGKFVFDAVPMGER